MLLAELVKTSRSVGETRARLQKVARLADLLRRAGPGEIRVLAAWLSGALTQGRVGLGPAAVRDALGGGLAGAASLTIGEVDDAFTRIAAAAGRGSTTERGRALGALFSRSTEAERDFLARLVLGELRQGALEGLVVEALAKARDVPAADVRSASMLAGSLVDVAGALWEEGAAGLARFRMETFRPVLPMLAQPAEDLDDALARLGEPALEHKLDGARVQVHALGGVVRVFSRGLNEVTSAVPELVEAVGALPLREAILDGEVLALRPGGGPQPFQVTMRRFGRKLDVEALRAELPLRAWFFDVLKLDGEDLVARPASERFEALEGAAPGLTMPRLVTSDPAQARAFMDAAVAQGHEGVMAKSTSAPYEAGSRGSSWLKVKPAHELDLVVLAAEWGSGRRQGWLSNLHLGARDPAAGGFVMLGKTFKGMTDAMLAWQTEALLALEMGREAHVVHVRPELVVQVAFNNVQASEQYPGGVALRFARVKRYRQDKRADDADTIESVRAVLASEVARGGG